MSWDEFKRQVEAAGVEGDDEIDYIDIDSTSEVDVCRRLSPDGDVTTFTVLCL